MDKETVVSQQIDQGKLLIVVLAQNGFDVQVAFWAKPTDEGKWFLYLASWTVDDKGPAAAYRFVHKILREKSVWIDPLEIRVIGLHDSLTEAAVAATKPNVPDSPYAVRNPKPYPGMTSFDGPTLGGLNIDGAYIYPPLPQGDEDTGKIMADEAEPSDRESQVGERPKRHVVRPGERGIIL
jgi:hypothetical protein